MLPTAVAMLISGISCCWAAAGAGSRKLRIRTATKTAAMILNFAERAADLFTACPLT
jgi:hypothetical protein